MHADVFENGIFSIRTNDKPDNVTPYGRTNWNKFADAQNETNEINWVQSCEFTSLTTHFYHKNAFSNRKWIIFHVSKVSISLMPLHWQRNRIVKKSRKMQDFKSEYDLSTSKQETFPNLGTKDDLRVNEYQIEPSQYPSQRSFFIPLKRRKKKFLRKKRNNMVFGWISDQISDRTNVKIVTLWKNPPQSNKSMNVLMK